ncbi:hypothetical protein [Mycobacterium sp. E2733]|uniref:hypothetical protein n=1 Tax=Mycobacterium sp. E2733 TaxID=1834138 RepID=UPI000AF81BEC|nr:hypothetical protein [Mycobacterium sp. E2733]
MTGGDGTVKSAPAVLGGLVSAPEAPPPTPFPLSAGGTSPADGFRGALEAAGNAGVPKDAADAAAADADRRAHAADAAAKFPVNEAESQQQMQNVGQQAPQMLQSITGALGGAVGGIMQPLTQLPQQAMQAGQSAIQPLMSAVQGAHGAGLASDAHLVDSVGPGSGVGAGGGSGGGAGLGGGGGTTPASSLGPPPVPTSSPPTTPAGAAKAAMLPPVSGAPITSGQTGMGGMGMMPPGAIGAGGDGNKEKPPEKRISAPGVPNGQPVKGRLTMPPSPPGPKPGEEKPTVVSNRPNRRIVIMPSEDEAKE